MVTSGTMFTAETLSRLLHRPNACVIRKKCKRHIALCPNALIDTKIAICDHLNDLVSKFDSELNGVVLGFKNINVLTNFGCILDDSPDIHFDIEAQFYIFKPERGSVLTGIVKKKSRDNIACLVHDIFNASIPIDVDVGSGVDINKISIGEPLTFTVEVVDFNESLPYICGKLVESEQEIQVTPVDVSSDRKRKKSDHQIQKKFKTERDKSINVEKTKHLKSNKSNVTEHLSTLSMELEKNTENFKTKLGTKHPTSILKKSSSAGVESSPARRISFYGDVPGALANPTETMLDSGENKTSIKNKKRKLYAADKETLENLENSDEREIPEKSGSVKIKKKKKKKELLESTENTVEVSEKFNMDDHSIQLEKKGKSKNVLENVSLQDKGDTGKAKQEGKSVTKNKMNKKSKKAKEVLYFQSEIVDKDVYFQLQTGTVQSEKKSPKKFTSGRENDNNENYIVAQVVPPLTQKKESELKMQVNKTLKNVREVQSKKKKREKKEDLSEGYGVDDILAVDEKDNRRAKSLASDILSAAHVSVRADFDQRTINISPVDSVCDKLTMDDSKKKKKKAISFDQVNTNEIDQRTKNISPAISDFVELSVDNSKKKEKKMKAARSDRVEMNQNNKRTKKVSTAIHDFLELAEDNSKKKKKKVKATSSDRVEMDQINKRSKNISPANSNFVELTVGDKSKKKKKEKKTPSSNHIELDILSPCEGHAELSVDVNDKKARIKKSQDSNERLSSVCSVVTKKKPKANSTIIANNTLSPKEDCSEKETDISLDSLSPIKKPDNAGVKSDEEGGFVTSTQIDTYPVLAKSPKKARKEKVLATEELKGTLCTSKSTSGLHKSKDYVRFTDTVFSSPKRNISPKKSQSPEKLLLKTTDTSFSSPRPVLASGKFSSQTYMTPGSDSDNSSSSSSSVGSSTSDKIKRKNAMLKKVLLKTSDNFSSPRTLLGSGKLSSQTYGTPGSDSENSSSSSSSGGSSTSDNKKKKEEKKAMPEKMLLKISDNNFSSPRTLLGSGKLSSQAYVPPGSDSDSNNNSSSSDSIVLPNINVLLEKNEQTNVKQSSVKSLKNAGSESSSSDTDVSHPEMVGISHRIGNQRTEKTSQEKCNVKTVDSDESSSGEDSVGSEEVTPNTKQKNVLSINQQNETESDYDSDLPSDRNIRKKMAWCLNIAKKNDNKQLSTVRTSSMTGEQLTDKSSVSLKKKIEEDSNALIVEKYSSDSEDNQDKVSGLSLLKKGNPKKVSGSDSRKTSNLPASLKPGGYESSSSELSSNTQNKIVPQKKQKKKAASVLQRVARPQSPEKKVSGSETDSIVLDLLKKVKSDILEPSESFNRKVSKDDNNKKSKLKSSSAAGVTNKLNTKKHQEVISLAKEKKGIAANQDVEITSLNSAAQLARYADKLLKNL